MCSVIVKCNQISPHKVTGNMRYLHKTAFSSASNPKSMYNHLSLPRNTYFNIKLIRQRSWSIFNLTTTNNGKCVLSSNDCLWQISTHCPGQRWWCHQSAAAKRLSVDEQIMSHSHSFCQICRPPNLMFSLSKLTTTDLLFQIDYNSRKCKYLKCFCDLDKV